MNSNELIVRKDLLDLEQRVLERFEALLNKDVSRGKQWIRSKEVQEMLSLSSSSLQNMRNQGLIPFKKIAGTIFYPYDGIIDVLKKSE